MQCTGCHQNLPRPPSHTLSRSPATSLHAVTVTCNIIACCHCHLQHQCMHAVTVTCNIIACCHGHLQHQRMLSLSPATSLHAVTVTCNINACCHRHLQHQCMLSPSPATSLHAVTVTCMLRDSFPEWFQGSCKQLCNKLLLRCHHCLDTMTYGCYIR